MVISYGDDDDEGDKEVILVNTLEVIRLIFISKMVISYGDDDNDEGDKEVILVNTLEVNK